MRILSPLFVLVVAAALAAPAHAGGPGLELGVAEDAVRGSTLVETRAQLALVRLAGFTAVRVTSKWAPGQVAPTPGELAVLRNVAAGAALSGVKVYVAVFAAGSATTPLTPEAQDQLAATVAAIVRDVPSLDDVVIGNEPNLNRFWLPQFGPDGVNASAPAYLGLLARAYDAVEAVDPGARVWGGATAARGSDRPDGQRPTTSPTAFVRALGTAYRASGRTAPVMDGYVHHPYPDSSEQSPAVAHPTTTTIGVADYDKLVALLAEAFDGTAQPGSSLPILYGELGIESRIPPGKAPLYSGKEPTTTRPVDERKQAASYETAIRLSFCQPNVRGLLLFHARDEPALAAWQSGIYYADGTPKASFYGVRDAVRRVRGGSIARCPGLALPIRLTDVRFPTSDTFARGDRVVRFRCDLDCAWEVRALRADGAVAATTRGWGLAGERATASLGRRRFGGQPIRLELRALHPVNPGPPRVRRSVELRAD
ncbi:MAG: hypothetical protein ACRC50_05505 [Gaiella sp.]